MDTRLQRMHQQLVGELLAQAMAAVRRRTPERETDPGKIGRIARRLRERRAPAPAVSPTDVGRER